MTQLTQGQRLPLNQLGLSHQFTIQVTCDLADADFTLFGLQGGTLKDDRWMVFFNQTASPDGALVQVDPQRFHLDLDQLGPNIDEVYLTATHDTRPISAASRLDVTIGAHVFDARAALKDEKAVMLVRFYRKDGAWRLGTVAQGFNGGLAALVQHFGGEVADDAASTPPAPTPVSLVKERQKVLLAKAEKEQPQLVSLMKAASVSLAKRGLDEARYQVKLVLDISASMSNEYRSGSVQDLANRALALATQLDDDGEVEVYLFGIRAHRKGTLSLSNARDFVDNMRVNLEGGTHYGPVMKMVREDVRSSSSRAPTLVLFITDGGTSNPSSVITLMREMSREPIFWKFMGIEEGRVNFDFLEKLDDLTGRAVDNADFFKVKAPVRVPDGELFDLLVNELDSWQRGAKLAGIL
ncbi:VWA domain-containing protein [Deinococcus daejeonensis]|uniref:Tellurium resistance protein n=1 Tax=Deinococcus daejeonensis TaxID=1007098 RepID=A0ABQ2JFF5_9DEIO|nr:VWA domain-containing protein [Deinococcus daejeonensis]GGN46485.1 tellurium resistance protein [Deinococcus daejeonensis]